MASMFLGMTLSCNHNCRFVKLLELELCGWEMIGCPAVRVCNEYKHFKRALDGTLVLRDFVHSLIGARTFCHPERCIESSHCFRHVLDDTHFGMHVVTSFQAPLHQNVCCILSNAKALSTEHVNDQSGRGEMSQTEYVNEERKKT